MSGTVTTDGRVRHLQALDLESAIGRGAISAGGDSLTFSGSTEPTRRPTDLWDGSRFALADSTMLTITSASAALGNIPAASTAGGTRVVLRVATNARDGQIGVRGSRAHVDVGGPGARRCRSSSRRRAGGVGLHGRRRCHSARRSSGNGDGVVEVGETVVLAPDGAQPRQRRGRESVTVSATAASGITFVDDADSYGSIPARRRRPGRTGTCSRWTTAPARRSI